MLFQNISKRKLKEYTIFFGMEKNRASQAPILTLSLSKSTKLTVIIPDFYYVVELILDSI